MLKKGFLIVLMLAAWGGLDLSASAMQPETSGYRQAAYKDEETAARVCGRGGEVALVHTHGVLSQNRQTFTEGVKILQDAFAGRCLGEYKISSNYGQVFWGDLPRNLSDDGSAWSVMKDGLNTINTRHNRLCTMKLENGEDNGRFSRALLGNILLEPFIGMFDRGSSCTVSTLRAMGHNFAHDQVWMLTGRMVEGEKYNRNLGAIYEIIERSLPPKGQPFILIGHSGGSVAFIRYVRDRMIHCQGDACTDRKDDFRGLITYGCPVNTVLAEDLAHLEDNPLYAFFTGRNVFWINYNNRNDIVASDLPDAWTTIQKDTPGFIASGIFKRVRVERIPILNMIFYRASHIDQAHFWYFHKPNTFAAEIQKIYEDHRPAP